MFEGDNASLEPYIASGHYLPFAGGQELVPGIRAIPPPCTPSRTPASCRSRRWPQQAIAGSLHLEHNAWSTTQSFVDNDPTYGARWVWHDVLAAGATCGLQRDYAAGTAVGRRLDANAAAANALDRQLVTTAPNQKWTADFTSIWTAEAGCEQFQKPWPRRAPYLVGPESLGAFLPPMQMVRQSQSYPRLSQHNGPNGSGNAQATPCREF